MLLLTYRVKARNTALDSENKIHDDAVAAAYGFKGGLVPGVTVYAYMTAPIVSKYGLKWLERGSMQVRFLKPIYDGEDAVVRAEVEAVDGLTEATMRVERKDGRLCATGTAWLGDRPNPLGEPRIESFAKCPLPCEADRADACPEAFVPGAPLGTISEMMNLGDTTAIDAIQDRLTFYRGAAAVAHPYVLLSLSNQALMRNFKLGPWIHVGSELVNWSTARHGDLISVRSRIRDCFERGGHEFVVMDVLLIANSSRIVQQVRHTAIYRPKLTERT